MTTETYSIVRSAGGWTIDHDGSLEGDYETKKSAFEAIALAASSAIKDGVGVTINVPARSSGKSALGSRP